MRRSVTYPRHVVRRRLLRAVDSIAFRLLTRLHIEARENLPQRGPFIVVANHFNFADPAALIRAVPHPLEFLAGTERPTAPNRIVRRLPDLWGTFNVHRGSVSRDALRSARSILSQGGVLGIFPEGGAWAQVLRYPRPGVAYLAVESAAPIVPLGLIGMDNIFPALRQGRRAVVRVRVGRPFGPFQTSGRGRARRRQLDEIGHTIMRRIADLLPAERRGVYSNDPALRAAAEEVAAFPWQDRAES